MSVKEPDVNVSHSLSLLSLISELKLTCKEIKYSIICGFNLSKMIGFISKFGY
jgi:hypothetical protein